MTDRAWPTAPKRREPERLPDGSIPYFSFAALEAADRADAAITAIPLHIAALPEGEQGSALVQSIHDRKKASQ